MSKKACLVLSLVLIMCGIAMAASKPLSDQQLATVTAGSAFGASGSVVALPGSDVDVTAKSTIDLSDSVLQEAKAVNVVNSVGGAWGAQVNVWDGATKADSDPRGHGDSASWLPGFGVKQVNVLNNSVPTAQGAYVSDYFSKGSFFAKDPSVKISKTDLKVDLGYFKESDFKVSNTYDQFLGLAAAANLDLDKHSADANAAICVICNTYDRFKLSDKDVAAAWANLKYDDFSLDAKADIVKTRGPIHIDDAYAEYFVGEDASLKAEDITALTMSGNTLYKASAVNIVNSVNSLVGAQVNVASASSGLSKQVNIINNIASFPVVGN